MLGKLKSAFDIVSAGLAKYYARGTVSTKSVRYHWRYG